VQSNRARLRLVLFSVVVIVIGVASIVETPGTTEGIGYAVVILALVLIVARERRSARR
jgi:hypothetical protein